MKNLYESIVIAFKQLISNKLRSVLSLVGIMIAVGAVTGILSLGDGLQRAIYQEFEQIGGFTAIWSWAPDAWYRDDSGRWVRRNWEIRLTQHDIDAIKAETDKIDFIIPNAGGGNMYIRHSDTAMEGVQVRFTSPEMILADNLTMARGRFLSRLDLINRAKVAVIGWDVAKNLFEAGIDPIGKEIKLNGMRHTVIGVTEDKEFFGNNYNNRALIPVTTGLTRFQGNDYLGYIYVKAKTVEDVDEVVAAMRRVYRRLHEHGEEMSIRTGQEEITEINNVLLIMELVAGGIAGISLLVGGIGIMNIMLVSVTERTREIGIRKSLGAKSLYILQQFLTEAIVLCMFGGMLGVGFGVLIGRVLSAIIMNFSEVPFHSVMSPKMILLAVGFSVFVGITFGVYPAWKAARMNPVEALRHE